MVSCVKVLGPAERAESTKHQRCFLIAREPFFRVVLGRLQSLIRRSDSAAAKLLRLDLVYSIRASVLLKD